jgi:hypothetical protein
MKKTVLILFMSLFASALAQADVINCQAPSGEKYVFITYPTTYGLSVQLPHGYAAGQFSYTYGEQNTRLAGTITGIEGNFSGDDHIKEQNGTFWIDLLFYQTGSIRLGDGAGSIQFGDGTQVKLNCE